MQRTYCAVSSFSSVTGGAEDDADDEEGGFELLIELSISSGSFSSSDIVGCGEETGKSVSASEEYSELSETELSIPFSYAAPLFLHAAKVSDDKRKHSAHSQISFAFNFFIFTSFFYRFAEKYCQKFRKSIVKCNEKKVNSRKKEAKGNDGKIDTLWKISS